MGYIFLILTILVESASVILMKLSGGFANKPYAIAAFLLYCSSFLFLTLALKTLPAALANAVWAGISTLLVAFVSAAFLGEHLNKVQWICLLLISVGLAGLHLASAKS